MNKKIAIVNHNLGSGGAEKLIYDMALELKKRKIEFSVILLTSVADIYGKKLLEKGVDVIYLSNKWDIYSFKNIFRLKNILKKYDIIHTHIYSAQLWTAFASLFLSKNKKYITTEHSTSNRRRNRKIFKYFDKWMYSRYNKIISITEATQVNLKNWLADKVDNKYIIINNGINLNNYYKIQKKERWRIHQDISEEDILICMVGRFSKEKDHKTLIKSIKNLEENYKLILLGAGNHFEEDRLITELGLDKKVYFLGYRYDAAEIVKACDVSVLSSNWEGFGLAAVESMALGIPTIGSDVEGLKEVLNNGGLIFQRGDYEELTKLIFDLTKDKEKYQKISNQGIEKSKLYSLDNFVKEHLKVYKEVKNC